MNEKQINEILLKLPHETAQYAVRDITVLTCSIFCETYIDSLKRLFNVTHSINFWYTREDGQVTFYRSGAELENLIQQTGPECLKDEQFAKKAADTLIEMTDYINKFIKENNTLDKLVNDWQHFYETYRDFFAYHQVVYWASEYLTKGKNVPEQDRGKASEIVKILDHAYKYNEKVVPNVEEYFINLDIGHLVYFEINKNVKENIEKAPKKRSILWVGDGDFQVLSFEVASEIDKAIRADYDEYLKTVKEIKGLGVSKGVVQGKVKLVTDLSQLKDCQPDDVLVTTMTRPQYNTFIKKVKAVVTDEGGMLCHASMLAREFGIPCVVGTKNATKLLEDDELVEVNANEGIVKILNT